MTIAGAVRGAGEREAQYVWRSLTRLTWHAPRRVHRWLDGRAIRRRANPDDRALPGAVASRIHMTARLIYALHGVGACHEWYGTAHRAGETHCQAVGALAWAWADVVLDVLARWDAPAYEEPPCRSVIERPPRPVGSTAPPA